MDYTRDQKKRWDKLSLEQATRRYHRGLRDEPVAMVYSGTEDPHVNPDWAVWRSEAVEHEAFVKYLKDRQKAELPYFTMGKAGSQEEAKSFDIKKLQIKGRSGQSVPTFVGEGTKTGGGASV
jgi:hypothetical protein